MFDDLVNKKHKAVISTAACSALGRMIEKYFTSNGVAVINVVRRQGQVDMLKEAKCDYILNSNDENFKEDLKAMIKALQPTCLLDAVSGELTGQLLNAMPRKSIAHVYGVMSMKPVAGISGGSLIFEQKVIKGFHLE